VTNIETQQLKLYTFSDYDKWSEHERWEIIDGIKYPTYGYESNADAEPRAMAAPVSNHQMISGELFGILREFLKGRRCRAFHAPFTVRLDADDEWEGDVVLEPDIVVICDPTKVDKKGCKGVPDLVMEILSPSTRKKDKLIKLQKYQKYGVREYWILDPDKKTLDVYLRVGSKYTQTSYSETCTAPVMVLPNLEIELSEIFNAMEDWQKMEEAE
jgi:Uma2 family endonuclease